LGPSLGRIPNVAPIVIPTALTAFELAKFPQVRLTIVEEIFYSLSSRPLRSGTIDVANPGASIRVAHEFEAFSYIDSSVSLAARVPQKAQNSTSSRIFLSKTSRRTFLAPARTDTVPRYAVAAFDRAALHPQIVLKAGQFRVFSAWSADG